jgi:hypothetical protein
VTINVLNFLSCSDIFVKSCGSICNFNCDCYLEILKTCKYENVVLNCYRDLGYKSLKGGGSISNVVIYCKEP